MTPLMERNERIKLHVRFLRLKFFFEMEENIPVSTFELNAFKLPEGTSLENKRLAFQKTVQKKFLSTFQYWNAVKRSAPVASFSDIEKMFEPYISLYEKYLKERKLIFTHHNDAIAELHPSYSR